MIYLEESFDYHRYVDENGFEIPDEEAEEAISRCNLILDPDCRAYKPAGLCARNEGFAPRAGA